MSCGFLGAEAAMSRNETHTYMVLISVTMGFLEEASRLSLLIHQAAASICSRYLCGLSVLFFQLPKYLFHPSFQISFLITSSCPWLMTRSPILNLSHLPSRPVPMTKTVELSFQPRIPFIGLVGS